ncbi:MAG TPA: hypothetical protein VJZ72_00300 [Candidatus Limnocylindrales bacterium]|nr:hypothetical protein [Candidatus Limnocylindrales bacterium]
MTSMGMAGSAGAWARQARALFYVAMAVFLVTIGIGLLNGLDIVEFNHDQLLTHVHSGTLGWITLSLVAASAWFARGIDSRLAWAMAIVVPVYVLAFYLAVPWLRAVVGGALLLVILWLVAWAWGIYTSRRSLPALAIALGFTTFTYGAIIGVLRQVQLANGPNLFPATADPIGAHASAMVFSYLILVAMGLLEWRVRGTSGLPMAGLVQLGALFAGGLVLSGTLLFLSGDAIQAAGGIDLLVNIVAVVIFAVRVVPAALRTDWMTGAGRHLAAASVFVLIAMAIFLYVVYKFISDPAVAADPTSIGGVLVASDHSAFIGVITNLVFGLLLTLTADRGDRWPWATQIGFWGTNLGLAVFLVGLVAESSMLKMIGAPVMGVSLLVGLAALAMRLRDSELRDEPA